MSTPVYQQRPQIVVVGPNQDRRLASVAPGQLVPSIQYQMEPDAPFLMRGRCYRVSYDTLASHTQEGVQNVAMRHTGPDLLYRSEQLIPQNLQMPFGGQSGAWKPVYPQIAFPARSTLTIDAQNLGATTLTNLTFYFLGVKLFNWGENPPSQTYPRKLKTTPQGPGDAALITPYSYGINSLIPPDLNNPTSSVQNLLTADQRLLQTFQNKPDSAFVIRTIQAGPSYAPFGLEVFLILRDENRKPYSNDWVHFEVLAGPSVGNYQTGAAGSVQSIGTGNTLPGFFFPELYLPANHVMYYDILRTDSGYAGTATIPNFPVQLMGPRVYAV